MDLFSYDDYRLYVRDRVRRDKSLGRGSFRQIAEALDMHTTNVSQVFRGQKSLTLEQACALGAFFGLSELEAEYLLALVQLERAGTPLLRKHASNRIASLRAASQELSQRLTQDGTLSELGKAVFYSNWYYTAISIAVDIEGLDNVEALAKYFSLPRAKVVETVQFLLANGLCIDDNGRIKMGPQRTHLESTSPHVARHHANWRQKAIERSPCLTADEELQYSAPVSLSGADAKHIRRLLLSTIDEALKIVGPSQSQEIFCLNMDWIKIR